MSFWLEDIFDKIFRKTGKSKTSSLRADPLSYQARCWVVAIFPGRTDKYFIKIFAIINNIRNNNNTSETDVVKLVDAMGSNLDGNRGEEI